MREKVAEQEKLLEHKAREIEQLTVGVCVRVQSSVLEGPSG